MAPRSRHLLQICRRCICTVNSGFDTARLLLCHPSATLTSRTGTPPQPVRHGTALSPSSSDRKALHLYGEFGVRHGEAVTLSSLGDAYLADGHPSAARKAWHRALAIFFRSAGAASVR